MRLKPPRLIRRIYKVPAHYIIKRKVLDVKDAVTEVIKTDPNCIHCRAAHDKTYRLFRRHTRYIP